MKILSLKNKALTTGLLLAAVFAVSCSKDGADETTTTPPVDGGGTTPPVSFDIASITDTYPGYTPANVYNWGYRNVHDPSILKDGDTYYCYSTDVCFGADIQPGIQVRKSTDLIKWDFVGWVFSKIPTMGADYIKSQGGTPFNALWAPYIMKVDNEYRLYYSLSSAVGRLSTIGLATASTPVGPWTEKGLAVSSPSDRTGTIQTNAIDPTVVIDQAGKHWMYYGSAWDGIYKLELNPATGLAMSNGDKGVRVAQRGSTGSSINGNIEGPEVVYNAKFNKYYLFIAYDWLQTKYNVRVGRADSPEGPFLDFDGKDINTAVDHSPMILAPYKFNGHSGWQGVSHCAVFKDDSDQYFMAHQGRPGENSFYMDLHVRKMFWTEDGWPIVSPERYAAVAQTTVAATDLVGNYEQIVLGYTVVPGYGAEQTDPNFQTSTNLKLDAAGTINGDANNKWTYTAPWLTLTWGGGTWVDKLHVEQGRDWENKKASTILLSGLNNAGTAVWGKKID